MNIPTAGVVAGSVWTPTAQRLELRLRRDESARSPRAIVRVDDRQVAEFKVEATGWTDYAVQGSWSAARHTVEVTSSPGRRGGDRNLRLDWVEFVAAAPGPAPTPTPIPTPIPTPTPTTPPVVDPYDERIVELVNSARATAGLAKVAVSSCADRYAEQWSAQMAATGILQHRTDLQSVVRACSARGIGENIAYANVTADQMMTMWMNSPGHRANILNPSYTHIGVGATKTASGRVYGTQNFLSL